MKKLSLSMLGAAAACGAMAQTVLYSTSFEGPFVNGNIAGQQGWVDELAGTSGTFPKFTVQGGPVLNGSKSVMFQTGAMGTATGTSTAYHDGALGVTADTLVATVWVRIDSASVNNSTFGLEFRGEDIFPPLGIYAIGPSVNLRASGSVDFARPDNLNNTTPNGLALGVWRRLELVATPGKGVGRTYATVDGQRVKGFTNFGTEVDSGTSGVDALNFATLVSSNVPYGGGTKGTNTGYYDSFAVQRFTAGTHWVGGRAILSDLLVSQAGRAVEITVTETGNPFNAVVASTMTDADGYFTVQLASIPADSCDVYAKGTTHLRARIGTVNFLNSAYVPAGTASLTNGDVDGDNVISVFDYIQISDAFDADSSAANWNANADLDGDGVVSVFDYIILSDHFDAFGEL